MQKGKKGKTTVRSGITLAKDGDTYRAKIGANNWVIKKFVNKAYPTYKWQARIKGQKAVLNCSTELGKCVEYAIAHEKKIQKRLDAQKEYKFECSGRFFRLDIDPYTAVDDKVNLFELSEDGARGWGMIKAATLEDLIGVIARIDHKLRSIKEERDGW
jgi:hypothetical protein